MRVSIKAIAAGATPTTLVASLPAKRVTVEQDGDSQEELIVNLIQYDGTFTADLGYKPGQVVELWRADGVLGRPPGYSAYLQPATGDPYMKIRTKSGSAINVRLSEFETIQVQTN